MPLTLISACGAEDILSLMQVGAWEDRGRENCYQIDIVRAWRANTFA